MAATNPVNGWDENLLAASETTFGTFVQPTAAQALQVISADLGPAAQPGQVRPIKDRSLGRGMQSGWVEGDKEPVDFTITYSQKTRADADDSARDLVVLKAAGLKETIGIGVQAGYTLRPTPIESAEFASMQLYRTLGSNGYTTQAEALNGCVVKSLTWNGGDQEVIVKASGQGTVKKFAGATDSFTFASNSDTEISCSAAQARLVSVGMPMQIESEVVLVTTVDYTTPDITFSRGAYSTTAAAHSAKRLYPYLPSSISHSGVPISEANASCILGSISPMRIISWEVDLKTGLDLLPAETSSAYRQGPKSVRHDVSIKLKMVLSQERVDLLGYALNRDSMALTLAQGTGAGGIITFGAPYCEVVDFAVPDTENDISIVDVTLRVRNNSTGDNALSITLT
jgi:hypothetical protein